MDIQKKILPDILDLLGKRYHILQLVRSIQPIGRRSLAQLMGMTERVVRSETEFLKAQGLLFFSTSGMQLTEEGSDILNEMGVVIRELFGLQELEQQLQNRLSVKKVVVVPGDSYTSPWIKNDLGRAAVEQLKLLVEERWSVSVAGGTTMAAVADAMTPSPKFNSLLYLPARGGLGEEVENQANTICSKMARKSGGNYRLLHVPDQLSKEAYDSLLFDPQIGEIVSLIRSSRMIIHGIGEANTMARRRKSSAGILQKIREKQAVAEAFGYYFNQYGEIIHKIQTIGLRLEDVQKADHILGIAGGKDKAMAILSFLKHGVHDVLITDEGAAKEMLNQFSK
jgi:central glycolytic genes regulator